MVRTVRNRVLAAAIFAALLASASKPAHAVSKEIIQLQTQVQQLLDMVQRLQSTMDTRFGVLQNLAQQTADQAKLVNGTVNEMQQKLNAQGEGVGGKVDTVSGQVQSLNDSVDELKSRIAKLDKTIQDLQAQLQNVQAPPAQSTMPGGAPGPGGQGAMGPAGQPGGAPAMSQTPPLQETFQSGLRDYNAGHYPVAQGEFQDVLHYYPLDDLAGSAQFYLGEIAYQQKKYDEAINSYNAVLEGFSGNPKAPAAQLHKGLALMAVNKRDPGIRELRLLIQRYPRTPEAASARSKLNAMGVRIATTTPTTK